MAPLLSRLAPLLTLFAPLAALPIPAAHAARAAAPVGKAAPARPKLVLVLVIDQFRADYLTRFESRFLAPALAHGAVGGFRYLMREGAYYPLAQYEVLQNMTCVGHATILTGSYPYRNGIPLNYWMDPNTGKTRYCVEDDRDGRSPRNLNGTTIGDELKNTGAPSRVVSIALKDRASILLGGHRADLALWFDTKASRWTTSRYYLAGEAPAWIAPLSADAAKRIGARSTWKSEGPGSGLSTNAGFVHEVEGEEALAGPLGVDLTRETAEAALDAYSLGRGKGTDILAVSFSSHDFAGHTYGPNSRELEELTLAEDRAISALLNRVRRELGSLKDVVVTLTADHGSPPMVEYLSDNRIESGRIDLKVLKDSLNARLDELLGKPPRGEWVSGTYDANVFFDPGAIGEHRRDRAWMEKLESAVKAAGLAMPQVTTAFTRFDYEAGRLPPGEIRRKIELTYYPERSAEVTFIPKPFFYTGDHRGLDHMSLYNYDSTVPLLLVGPGIRKGRRPEAARVVDLAPTLAYLLGTLPPALSEGRVLAEALTDSLASRRPESP